MQKITLEQMQTRKKQRGSSYFWAVYADAHSAPGNFKNWIFAKWKPQYAYIKSEQYINVRRNQNHISTKKKYCPFT